ncbi:uncharacterized protein N7484_005672 [Penicillium longicatenatum]|uniref:uncharacterized protein n=1 Tax=Penicillium longicatenatum TaxID=1561947 RepID=UPI002546A1E8|nr:uncharacterized protein N7484_005672 [Penicillium longicatenatum]KAJ5643165.1 hypothetical protein N7484_005672 [Penicillium longicatenatum]
MSPVDLTSTLQTSEPNTNQHRGTKRQRSIDSDGDANRKHGKRLTTREEVSLFEICNRHAESFGKRSDICNWWRGVAEEFTRAHGRPYSWHSVRRKVELVTKQRVKFLEDQRQQRAISGAQLSEDSMNPQWCAVLDMWIPTWVRWQESEARRIEKRDEMIRRRTISQTQVNEERVRSSGYDEMFGQEMGAAPLAIAPYDVQSSVSLPVGVKLPPGYESMFSGHTSTQCTPVMQTQTEKSPPNDRMMNAVLDTLGKLNKHLDTTSVHGSPDHRDSPVLSALVQAASESSADLSSGTGHQANAYGSVSVDIERIKEELRQEMQFELRRELDRDRAIFKEKLDSVQRTQEMILQMLQQDSV